MIKKYCAHLPKKCKTDIEQINEDIKNQVFPDDILKEKLEEHLVTINRNSLVKHTTEGGVEVDNYEVSTIEGEELFNNRKDYRSGNNVTITPIMEEIPNPNFNPEEEVSEENPETILRETNAREFISPDVTVEEVEPFSLNEREELPEVEEQFTPDGLPRLRTLSLDADVRNIDLDALDNLEDEEQEREPKILPFENGEIINAMERGEGTHDVIYTRIKNNKTNTTNVDLTEDHRIWSPVVASEFDEETETRTTDRIKVSEHQIDLGSSTNVEGDLSVKNDAKILGSASVGKDLNVGGGAHIEGIARVDQYLFQMVNYNRTQALPTPDEPIYQRPFSEVEIQGEGNAIVNIERESLLLESENIRMSHKIIATKDNVGLQEIVTHDYVGNEDLQLGDKVVAGMTLSEDKKVLDVYVRDDNDTKTTACNRPIGYVPDTQENPTGALKFVGMIGNEVAADKIKLQEHSTTGVLPVQLQPVNGTPRIQVFPNGSQTPKNVAYLDDFQLKEYKSSNYINIDRSNDKIFFNESMVSAGKTFLLNTPGDYSTDLTNWFKGIKITPFVNRFCYIINQTAEEIKYNKVYSQISIPDNLNQLFEVGFGNKPDAFRGYNEYSFPLEINVVAESGWPGKAPDSSSNNNSWFFVQFQNSQGGSISQEQFNGTPIDSIPLIKRGSKSNTRIYHFSGLVTYGIIGSNPYSFLKRVFLSAVSTDESGGDWFSHSVCFTRESSTVKFDYYNKDYNGNFEY